MKKSFENYWIIYKPLINALVELFYPLMEVVVHDLEKGKIVAIYHTLSKRKVGDSSPLNELMVNTKAFPDYFLPYYKKNWDDRSLKCTSLPIRDERKKVLGLICFNVDASLIQDAHKLLGTFLKIKNEKENPIEMFGGSSDDQIMDMIKKYLNEKRLSLTHLTRTQKKELVQHLYHKGIFNFKNAPQFLAYNLNLSRASIYNYIKQLGETE